MPQDNIEVKGKDPAGTLVVTFHAPTTKQLLRAMRKFAAKFGS